MSLVRSSWAVGLGPAFCKKQKTICIYIYIELVNPKKKVEFCLEAMIAMLFQKIPIFFLHQRTCILYWKKFVLLLNCFIRIKLRLRDWKFKNFCKKFGICNFNGCTFCRKKVIERKIFQYSLKYFYWLLDFRDKLFYIHSLISKAIAIYSSEQPVTVSLYPTFAIKDPQSTLKNVKKCP